MTQRGRKRGQQHSTAHNDKQQDLLDPRYEQIEHLIREAFAYDGAIVIDRRTGDPAGTLSSGHLTVSFYGHILPVSHIAWFLHEDRWPREWLEIDHKNRIGTDNRWDNLREATYSQNSANKPTRSKTGHKGVYRHQDGRYIVHINKKYYGIYYNLMAAATRADEIRHQLYGEYADEPTTTGAPVTPNRYGEDYTSPRKKRARQHDAEPSTQQLQLWQETEL